MIDPGEAGPMDAAAFEREVRELHRFFERWYAGTIDRRAFTRLDVLAPTFVMIDPGGRSFRVGAVREMVASGYGSRPFHIEIRNVHVVPGAWAGTYEEWHTGDDGITGRMSTALMSPDTAAPNGLRWLHLHETWLPADRV